MKRALYIVSTALYLFSSCQSDPGKTVEERPAAAKVEAPEKTLVLPWTVELNESTQLMEIKKDPAANMTNLEPQDMVDALNIKYPQIKLEWVKQEGDKAFVKIMDAAFLTQQSGTEGARAYLAEATFSLTELKSINEVDFSFTEGDHARPGVYTRDDFKGFN